MARWTVVGPVSLLVVLGLTPSVVEAILLEVDYPENGNYSYVTLTCKKDRIDDLSSDQQPATFWRGTSQITSGSQLVTAVLAETDVSISFVFNQTQEGSFSCKTALDNDEVSNVEALAASPYITPMMPHYILFPSLDHTRKVNLSCAIQPGALTDNYRVSWRRVEPTLIFYSDDTFNITVTETTEMSSTPSEYQCIVTIDHSSMDDEEYEPPIIVVKKRVLSALSGEIGDVSVATGEPATFVCNALKRDTDFSISWKVEGETYTCGGTDTSSDNIHCYMKNETACVLKIENTAALDIRSHSVECILQNFVPENFREDCVSLPRGSCDVTKSATLEISNGPTPPTVTSSLDCGHPPELENGRISNLSNSTASYECNDGYYFHNNDTSRTCLSSGNWSDENILCSLDCGHPPELENGRISNLSNSTASYECNDGYYFHNNDTSRTCLSSGNWSDENILCKEDSICEGIFCRFGAGALTAIFTSAAVILVPLCIAVGCAVRQWLRKSKRSSNIWSFDYSDRKANTLELRSLPEVPGSSRSSVPTLKEELSTKRMLFQSSQLQLSKVVGQGESGLVYRGYIRANEGNMLVAIKTGKALVAVTDKERLLKEVSLMLTFSHPNVMPLIGLSFDEETPLIIMPFMSNGTVLSYVRDNRKNLYFLEASDNIQVEAARKTCLGICYQISNGMAYLANYKIDENGIIKVADFGLTEDMYNTNYYRQEKRQTGTEEKVPIKWMALESIETHVFDESTDVWSFGVTCWEVFTCGGVPYAGVPVTTLLRELRSGHRLDRPSNISCSDDIWSVVTSCWSASPQERPKFATLVNTLTDLLDSDSNYLKLLG